ncbi:MAG TPA: hypothetical protein VHF58_01030, partial [Solirubrobacterales bacterium]|nr:hypothetical protein [Solirubrobacterales bacterium]
VTGAETLDPGTYEFLCSIHTFMSGSIRVRGGGGGAGGGTPPLLRLTPIDESLAKAERAGKLRFRTTLDEKATVQVTATAKSGAKVAAGRAKLDRGKDKIAAKLTRKGERLVGEGKPLKLKVAGRATDADGDSSKTRIELKLR